MAAARKTAARGRAGRAAHKPNAAEVAEQKLFDDLSAVLERLGHSVHVSRTLDGRGGDCLVNGTKRVIVSRRLPLVERVDVLVEVLRRQDLGEAEVAPEILEVLKGTRAAS